MTSNFDEEDDFIHVGPEPAYVDPEKQKELDQRTGLQKIEEQLKIATHALWIAKSIADDTNTSFTFTPESGLNSARYDPEYGWENNWDSSSSNC